LHPTNSTIRGTNAKNQNQDFFIERTSYWDEKTKKKELLDRTISQKSTLVVLTIDGYAENLRFFSFTLTYGVAFCQ